MLFRFILAALAITLISFVFVCMLTTPFTVPSNRLLARATILFVFKFPLSVKASNGFVVLPRLHVPVALGTISVKPELPIIH